MELEKFYFATAVGLLGFSIITLVQFKTDWFAIKAVLSFSVLTFIVSATSAFFALNYLANLVVSPVVLDLYRRRLPSVYKSMDDRNSSERGYVFSGLVAVASGLTGAVSLSVAIVMILFYQLGH